MLIHLMSFIALLKRPPCASGESKKSKTLPKVWKARRNADSFKDFLHRWYLKREWPGYQIQMLACWRKFRVQTCLVVTKSLRMTKITESIHAQCYGITLSSTCSSTFYDCSKTWFLHWGGFESIICVLSKTLKRGQTAQWLRQLWTLMKAVCEMFIFKRKNS